ncbi:hypothetical protein KR026_011060 [Drosophila bipectinata]|nr:hypothetical protein KR026_011060 [Drosophila bipectinata]
MLPACPENVYEMKLAEDYSQPDIRTLRIDSLNLDHQLVEIGNVRRATEQSIKILRNSICGDLKVCENNQKNLGNLESFQYHLEREQHLCQERYRSIKLLKLGMESFAVLGTSVMDNKMIMLTSLHHLLRFKDHQDYEQRARFIICYLYNGAAFLLNCIRSMILEQTGKPSSVDLNRVVQRFMKHRKGRRFSSLSF